MNTQIKFKLLTIIINSKANEAQKKILEKYIEKLKDSDLAMLMVAFENEPRSIAFYADYVQTLSSESKPVSSAKLEEILIPLLEKLS